MNIDSIIMSEYSKALNDQSEYLANERQPLCSMEAYDRELLKKIPEIIIKNDFGCGNPSKYVRPGDAVLDLGSGSGKICYILSQIVGPTGKVYGIDVNIDMLRLARSQQETFSEAIGYDNMNFFHANIADMKTDLDKVETLLVRSAIDSLEKFKAFEHRRTEIFNANPLISDGCIDVIVSNCVINLVKTTEKVNVFREMFRVLRPGGRIAISDNTSNINVPLEQQNDPKLWTACYSGVFQEQEFYRVLEAAGFEGIRIEARNGEPAKVISGVEIRSVTITAVKPFKNALSDSGSHNVIYRGPWLEVIDENGVRLRRGEVSQVSNQNTEKFKTESYSDELFIVGINSTATALECCSIESPTSNTCC